MYTVWSNNLTVWSKFLTVWLKSLRCEQNVYGVIKNLRVWSKIWRCDQTFKGVIKNLTVWSKLRWCDQDIVGVIKRPFAGNCLITPCGVIISHVFFWCGAPSSWSVEVGRERGGLAMPCIAYLPIASWCSLLRGMRTVGRLVVHRHVAPTICFSDPKLCGALWEQLELAPAEDPLLMSFTVDNDTFLAGGIGTAPGLCVACTRMDSSSVRGLCVHAMACVCGADRASAGCVCATARARAACKRGSALRETAWHGAPARAVCVIGRARTRMQAGQCAAPGRATGQRWSATRGHLQRESFQIQAPNWFTATFIWPCVDVCGARVYEMQYLLILVQKRWATFENWTHRRFFSYYF